MNAPAQTDVFLLMFLLVMGVGIGLLLGAWLTVEALRAGDRILNADGTDLHLTDACNCTQTGRGAIEAAS